MAKKKKGPGRKGRPEGFTNPVAVAMLKRYGQTTSTHKNRGEKRRNRQSWRDDERRAWG